MSRVELCRVGKQFPGVRALHDVSLAIGDGDASATGEVLGLVGENGAGKSALIKILAGVYPGGAPAQARTAVSGWLWFMDGACLDWIENGGFSREELRNLLLGVLFGSLAATGSPPDLGPLAG